jgi:hypothetical protein
MLGFIPFNPTYQAASLRLCGEHTYLEHMPVTSVATIKIDGIPREQSAHETRNQLLAALNKDVGVIAEQGPGIHHRIRCRFPETAHKLFPVPAILDDLP